jgi:hypothetical protein
VASMLIRAIAVGCIGILSGAMAEEYFVLRRVLANLDGAQWGAAHAAFGSFHPFTIIPLAIVGTLAVFATAALERPRRSTRAMLTWVVAAAAAAVGILTMAVMFPLNHEIEAWASRGTPADWQLVRDRWISLQALRASLSVGGFLLLVASSFLGTRSSPPRAG